MKKDDGPDVQTAISEKFSVSSMACGIACPTVQGNVIIGGTKRNVNFGDWLIMGVSCHSFPGSVSSPLMDLRN